MIHSPTGGLTSAICSVNITLNTLTIYNAFGTNGSYIKNGPILSFIFSAGGINSIKDSYVGAYNVTTYASISG